MQLSMLMPSMTSLSQTHFPDAVPALLSFAIINAIWVYSSLQKEAIVLILLAQPLPIGHNHCHPGECLRIQASVSSVVPVRQGTLLLHPHPSSTYAESNILQCNYPQCLPELAEVLFGWLSSLCQTPHRAGMLVMLFTYGFL